MKKIFIVFLLVLAIPVFAANIALIDRPVGATHGGGFYNSALTTLGTDFDLFGTHPNATGMQNMYDNINDYNLIVFAMNAGKDSTINSIASNVTNQGTLRDWLSDGGQIFLNIYNDGGGGTNFLNLPGLGFSNADSNSGFTTLNDDDLLHSPNEVEAALQAVRGWEPLTSFPTGATNTKVILDLNGYKSMVSFNFGAGRVVFLGQPVGPTTSGPFPGLAQTSPGTELLFLENVLNELSGPAVPEPSSLILLCCGLVAFIRLKK